MPPFHGHGHGTRLYSFLFQMFMDDKKVAQVTVEDPNESFDDLRDRYYDLSLFLDRI
jgi:histone acetyltransferase 1